MTAPLPDGPDADQRRDGGSGDDDTLVDVIDLKMHFPVGGGFLGGPKIIVKAVDGVSFTIRRGETLGLVGESGSGKTTVGRTLLRLYTPTAGRILFEGSDIADLPNAELRKLRRRMQMVFQDPYSSLNPRQNVRNVIGEPLRVHDIAKGKDIERRVGDLLERVGMPRDVANRYPHEFSGGQRQRIGLARSLAVNPDLIVADEPVSALDVSIQAQVINLLEDLQDEFGLTYLFIAHDLAVVRHISDRIAVMYLGGIVEIANADELYTTPLHPYTKALLSAVPIPDPAVEATRERILLTGDMPSPANPPSGCRFHTRCPWVQPTRCRDEPPPLRPIPSVAGNEHHVASCHWVEEIESGQIQPRVVDMPGAAAEV